MTDNKKIQMGYLISQYPAISHTFILREIRRLRNEGFEIHVASINDPDRPYDALTPEEQHESDRTFYVKRTGFFHTFISCLKTAFSSPLSFFKGLLYALQLGGADLKQLVYNLFYFGEAVLVGNWMEKTKVDHVHVHFANPASTVALICSKIFPVTYSVTVHGPDEFYDVIHNYLLEKIEGSSFMMCIGYFTKSQLMRISPPTQWHKFEVSPLGVDPQVFTPRPARLNPNPYEILCVGRLVPSKGQHILLEALEILVKEGRNIHLTLIGEGSDRKSLVSDTNRRGLEEHVYFAGALNQPLVMEAYRKTDLFALASFAEGVPVVLMEAMAMEIPCVATHITGIPELIRPGKEGLLVVPADPWRLAKAIRTLMDDKELSNRIGKAGRERVLDKYRLDVNTKALARIFTRRLQNHTTPKEN
jgi:glycosyltransferase involved in cell wall biosynthesis